MNWIRIEELFNEVLLLAPNDRGPLLRSACSSDEERDHIVRLLNASELSTGVLSTSHHKHSQHAKYQTSHRIGDWRILEPLGSGGMADVYRVVRDSGDFSQYGALKIARTDSEELDHRFSQERALAAKLSHPSIPRLLDGGRSNDGEPFMVLDLISGRSITNYAAENNLALKEKIRMFLKLCEAVRYAHGKLILHRDIKPNNILVSDEGQLKLIDFGIAVFLDDASSSLSGPLTVAYAAPEQLDGNTTSAATDVYSLGIVLCELLTGARTLNNNTNLPSDLLSIIKKCTKQAPNDRFTSVDSLIFDIERYLANQPVLARDGGVLYQSSRFIKRNLIAVASTSATIVGLALALTFVISAYNKAETALQQTMHSAELWEFEARKSQGLRRAMLQLYGVSSESGEEISKEAIHERLMDLVTKAEFAAQKGDAQQAHDMYAIGDHFMMRFEHDKAINVFNRLLTIESADPFLLLRTKASLAWSLESAGQLEEALSLAETAILEPGLKSEINFLPLLQLESVIANSSNNVEARKEVIKKIESAIAFESKLPKSSQIFMPMYYNQIGFLHVRNGDYEKAAPAMVSEFEHARSSGVRSFHSLSAAVNAAQAHIYVLNQGKAPLEYLQDYLPYTNGELGRDDSWHGLIRILRAEAAIIEGDWDLVAAESELAVTLLSHDPSFRRGLLYRAKLVRARALIEKGDIQQAELLIERIPTVNGDERSKVLQACMYALGKVAVKSAKGNTFGARNGLSEAITICTGNDGRPIRVSFDFHVKGIESTL